MKRVPWFENTVKTWRALRVLYTYGDGEYLEPYWDWVKNQVMEKDIDFNGALQNPCTYVDKLVVEQLETFNHHWETNNFYDVTLFPLETVVGKVDFGEVHYDNGDAFVFMKDFNQNPEA